METFTKVKRYFIGVQLNIKICKQHSERDNKNGKQKQDKMNITLWSFYDYEC